MAAKRNTQGRIETDDSIHETSFVYLITNNINGKRYVGKTNTPKKRWQQHKRVAKDDNRRLYCSMRKYGIQNFDFQIIASFQSDYEAFQYEHEYVIKENLCDPKLGYNLTSGGRGGCRMSDEVKKRISTRLKGELNPMFGKKHDEETKKRISDSLKGENNPNFGIQKSNEIKEKMSKAQKGKKLTTEHKEKLRRAKLSDSNPHRGRKRSAETCRKMREAWILRKQKKCQT